MVTDAEILDLTETWHDQLDVHLRNSPGLPVKASFGGDVHFRIQQLRKRELTAAQLLELDAVRLRLYVECFLVPADRAHVMLRIQ
jgi:hypothetical protein